MSDTADFFRGRIDQMIDLRHPLAVLGADALWGKTVRGKLLIVLGLRYWGC